MIRASTRLIVAFVALASVLSAARVTTLTVSNVRPARPGWFSPLPIGNIDSTFGIVRTPMDVPLPSTSPNGQTDAHARCVALKNGKVVVGGFLDDQSSGFGASNFDFVVARYDTKGNLDATFKDSTNHRPGYVTETFGTTGAAMAENRCNGVAIQTDGRIVAVGYTGSNSSFPPTPSNTHFVVVRYLRDGRRDPKFGKNGVVETDFHQIAPGGVSKAQGVVLQPDGKILVAGSFWPPGPGAARFALARYMPEHGEPDYTFGINGCVVTNFGAGHDTRGYAIAVAGNSIVVSGTLLTLGPAISVMAVARYRIQDGHLDGSFNGTGKAFSFHPGISTEARAVAIDPAGSIVAAGWGYQGTDQFVALVRFTHSGKLDAKFGSGGLALGYGPAALANGLVIQPKGPPGPHGGWLTVAGQARFENPTRETFMLQRFSPVDGKVEPSFGAAGAVISPEVSPSPSDHGTAYALTMDGQFKIIAVGGASFPISPTTTISNVDFALVRYQ